jgi:hypothetical protein
MLTYFFECLLVSSWLTLTVSPFSAQLRETGSAYPEFVIFVAIGL